MTGREWLSGARREELLCMKSKLSGDRELQIILDLKYIRRLPIWKIANVLACSESTVFRRIEYLYEVIEQILSEE